MSPDAQVILAVVAGVAVVGMGVLAWRGVISWGWVAAGIAAFFGIVMQRRRSSPGAPAPRPDPISSRGPVDAVLAVADADADAEQADIDGRLDRLAGLNDGGRE